MRPTTRWLFLGACLAVLAAGPAAAPGGQAPPPESFSADCGSSYASTPSTSFWFEAVDGTRLHGVELGRGSVGIVLAHQFPDDLCGWAPYAVRLARSGHRVLLFDFRGFGLSANPPDPAHQRIGEDVVAAAAAIRARGARKVVLIGASLGGAAALAAGADVRPPLAGVVSLSGERDITALTGYPISPMRGVRRLRSPLLLMVSSEDGYASVASTRSMLVAGASRHKAMAVFAGTLHGWSLVEYGSTPTTRRARAAIASFLARFT